MRNKSTVEITAYVDEQGDLMLELPDMMGTIKLRKASPDERKRSRATPEGWIKTTVHKSLVPFSYWTGRKMRNPGTRFYAASTSTEKKTRNPDAYWSVRSEMDREARKRDAVSYFEEVATADWLRFQQDLKKGHYDAYDAKHYQERVRMALDWLDQQ